MYVNESGTPSTNGVPNPESKDLNQNSYSNNSAKLGFHKLPSKTFPDKAGYLAEAVRLVELALQMTTGHDNYQRKKIAYYAVATWAIRQFDPFPGLVIYGPPSTGKSMTLNVLKNTCWNPVPITAETTMPAALRDCMKEANYGTLIIEEADPISTRELEGILITRYSLSSAETKKMVPDGKGWELVQFPTFGATVTHRRNLFRNPALLRRMITVRTKRSKKNYSQLNSRSSLYKKFREQFKKIPTPPQVQNVWDIEPGIFDCYKPLLAVATYLNDTEFIAHLVNEMNSASKRLRDEETYLEAPTFLKIFIGLVYGKVKDKPTLDRIGIETRHINPALRDEFGADCPALMLSANQRNRILKEDLGFEIGASHGKSKAYLNIPLLIKACDEYGVEDDLLKQWKSQLKS